VRRLVFLVAAGVLLAGPAEGSVATFSPDPRAEIRGAGIWVDDRPFFPIFSWAQCLPTVDRTLEIGVNVFMGDHCDDLSGLAQAAYGRAYLLTPTWRRDLDGLPGRLGWFQPDEPDEYRIPPEQIPEKPVVPGKLTFITFTGHFADEMAQPSAEIGGKAAYPGYARKADVLGFDLYPLTNYCGHPWIDLGSSYRQQRDLVRLNSGGPTYQWIEVNELQGRCGPVSAAQVRAEIWLAVAGGATGIGYFTHGWPEGVWHHFHVADAVRAELARTSAELQRNAPMLLSRQGRPWTKSARSPVKVGVRHYRSKIYLIAVNSSGETASATFGIDAAVDGRATRLSDGAKLPVAKGRLRDTLGPLAVALYELEPGSRHSPSSTSASTTFPTSTPTWRGRPNDSTVVGSPRNWECPSTLSRTSVYPCGGTHTSTLTPTGSATTFSTSLRSETTRTLRGSAPA